MDSDGLNGTTLDGHLNKIILSSNEMSKLFNIPLEFDLLYGNIKFNGSLNKINISKFDLSNKDMLFSASADLRNIFDKDFEISTEIKSLYFSSNGIIQSLKSLPKSELGTSQITDIHFQNENALWVGSTSGLLKIDTEKRTVDKYNAKTKFDNLYGDRKSVV